MTTPHFFKDESARINEILEKDEATFVHIRKPYSNIMQMEQLIMNINPAYYKRLKLHDHFELIKKFDLGGCHLNSRNNEVPANCVSKSRSIHAIEELEDLEGFDYTFISPIFDSISKQNYKAAFDLEKISEKIKGKNLIALGGVTPDKFEFLQSKGFVGAALLGYFFPNEI